MTQLSVDGESASTAAASSISADLNQIVNWCDVNGLSISTEKTLTMFLSWNLPHLTQDHANSQISIRGHPLEKRSKIDRNYNS